MRKFIYLIAFVCLAATSYGQKSFEKQVEEISKRIETTVSKEKDILKKEVDDINDRLEKKLLSVEDADKMKLGEAEKCAKNIEVKIAPLEAELQTLVKQKAEGNYSSEYNVEQEKDNDDININLNLGKKKKRRGEPRTTSQFIFAFGINGLASDGDIGTIDNEDYKLYSSRFYELGFTWKTRVLANSSFLQFKYGLSLMYNNLRPEDNKYFAESGKQTILVKYPLELNKSPYFRNTQLVVPVHLEFDFSKKRISDDKIIIRSQQSVRAGFGGYAGVRTRTKQILEYKSDGNETHSVTKGDFNTNNFIYGISGYLGYKNTSIYAKYDLNPLFRNNIIDQNNFSIGLRFDID